VAVPRGIPLNTSRNGAPCYGRPIYVVLRSSNDSEVLVYFVAVGPDTERSLLPQSVVVAQFTDSPAVELCEASGEDHLLFWNCHVISPKEFRRICHMFDNRVFVSHSLPFCPPFLVTTITRRTIQSFACTSMCMSD